MTYRLDDLPTRRQEPRSAPGRHSYKATYRLVVMSTAGAVFHTRCRPEHPASTRGHRDAIPIPWEAAAVMRPWPPNAGSTTLELRVMA